MAQLDEIRLFQEMEADSPELAQRIRRLVQILDPQLSRIYSVFPAYTDHGRSHSEQVVNTLNWLLEVEMEQPLSAREMFYVLAAALLHDIGMLAAVGSVGDSDAQRQIRDSHHLRSEQYVTDNYERLELDAVDVRSVAELCRSHRRVDIAASVRDLPAPDGGTIRLQLLCAVLRLADELHLTADRAPKLVLEAIRPGAESRLHWQRHLSIDGVGPVEGSEGVIHISATAETADEEQALRAMVVAIQAELTQLEPILDCHGLPWRIVRLELQRRHVVAREVVLHLAKMGESTASTLSAELGEPQHEIDDCLRDLSALHHVSIDPAGDCVALVADFRTFQHWLRLFLNTREEIEFVLSPYAADCVEEFAFEEFRRQFGAAYDAQGSSHRITALQSSPTALNLLLFVSAFQVESSVLPRRVMLDAAILLGLVTDLFRFPQIAQIEGVQGAAEAIQARLSQETPGLMRLFSALASDVERSAADVARDLRDAPGGPSADAEGQVRFSLKVTHPASDVRRGLTFPHLLKASLKSGEPLEILGDKVELSSDDPKLAELMASPATRLILVPRKDRTRRVCGMMFCRLELDYGRRRIALLADMGRSAEYSKYPVAVRVVMSPDRKSATFSPSIYATHLDVQQALDIDQMYAWLGSGDFDRLEVEPDQWDETASGVPLPVMEALGSDFRDSEFHPFLDDAHRKILGNLALLQASLRDRIPFPLDLSEHQAKSIESLSEAARSLGTEEARERLEEIIAESCEELTTIRVSTYFHNGGIETDEFLGPFGRLPLRIEIDGEEANGRIAEALHSGSTEVFLTRGFAVGAARLAQEIGAGFSDPERIRFMPDEHAVSEHPQSMCQIVLHTVADKMWYRERVIHYQIRDFSSVDELLGLGHGLLEDDDTERAVAVLEDGLERFPKEPWVAVLLGWAHYKNGNLAAARERSAEAIDRSHGVWLMPLGHVHYNLGLFALLRGDVGEAISRYEEAISLDKGVPLEEGIEDLQAELSSGHPERIGVLAFLWESRGEMAKARELYERYLTSRSAQPELDELARRALDGLA